MLRRYTTGLCESGRPGSNGYLRAGDPVLCRLSDVRVRIRPAGFEPASTATARRRSSSELRACEEPPAGVEGAHALEIVRFYVDTTCQGRGIGAALMEECFDEARARSADVIWLQVWKQAPWAVGFYARMGFTIVGSAAFYFGEQIGDDHIMAKRVD